MVNFLRSRLICFYCNRGSSQKKQSGLKKFKCEYCEAENYLDANGDITDPPVDASSSFHYAVPVDRPSSPTSDTAPNHVFCNTCLQNQQIFAQSLAEYYPTPNLSTFEEYEQAEAEYRASLEQRYPLVCKYCEPLARKRLKDASYAAKVDNMRRVMDRTSPGLRHMHESGLWKLWIPFVGGWMWLCSWVGQIIWDLAGITKTLEDAPVDTFKNSAILEQLQQFVINWEMSPNFADQILWMARYALLLGLVSAWWNPRLKERMGKRGGRMTGKRDYYTQQLICFAVRSAAIYWLPPAGSVESERAQAAHLFLLVFSIGAIFRSYRTIQMDYTPKTLWKESPQSLLSLPPGQTSSPQGTPTANRRRHGAPRSNKFSIESLASKPLTSLSISDTEPKLDYAQPSFPPSDDTMDWTPTLSTPRPYAALHPPAPFKAPRSGAAAATSITDSSPNLSIFSNLSPTTTATTSTSIPTTHLADPKFFPRPITSTSNPSSSDETGLESIFDRAFTISHPPAEVRDLRMAEALQRQMEAERETRRRPARVAIRWRIGMLMILGCAYAILHLTTTTTTTTTENEWDMSSTPSSSSFSSWIMGGFIQLTSQQQQRGGILAFGLCAIVTLRDLTSAARDVQQQQQQQRVVLVFATIIQTAATAILGGVIFIGGEQQQQQQQQQQRPAMADDIIIYSGDGRSAAMGWQLAVAVMGLGQLVLLGRECVRVASMI